METFLAIQNTYQQVQMALSINGTLSDIISLDKTVASRDCINALDQLLCQNLVSLSDLSFIAVNHGPGPFTTLRVVISTVNGLSFASKISLIGINGMQALASEYSESQKVILLNAFGNDVYYLIETPGSQTMGVANAASLIQHVSQKIPHNPILFLGNGTLLYQELIAATFGDRAQIPDPLPETTSLQTIAQLAAARWKSQENISFELQPLYYKQPIIIP
ncbi:MAG: hypothetical protein AMXMBFR12_05060 [Candidatus Babeliales bacterium]